MAPNVVGFHHVNLSVLDLYRSEAWYAETLGFNRLKEMKDNSGRGAKVVMQHPECRILLGFTVHSAGSGIKFSEHICGLDHLAFAVPERADLEEWKHHFEERNIPYSLATTGALLTFRDPDNIQLQIYALA